jgi:hypothetical protein
MYKTPQRTSSAPSPIRNIFASQFIAAPHNRTGINRGKVGFVPAGTTEENKTAKHGADARVIDPSPAYGAPNGGLYDLD